MKREGEHPIWKVLTLVVTIVGIVCNMKCYYDTKESTERQIVKALSERYESVDREMSYEQALQAVDRDIKRLEAERSELQSNNALLTTELSEIKNGNDRAEKIALAESYAVSGNYETAIPILNSVSEKTGDISALLKDYTAKYEVSIIAEAETLAGNGDFNEALTIIDEALKIVPNSQTLLDRRKNIEPQYLVDTIECFKSENLWLLNNREYIKMGGKSYGNAIYSESFDLGVTMFNRGYTASAFYNLDGDYVQLSGIVGHIDFSGSGTIGENDGRQVYDAEVTIWGDGKEIDTIPLSADATAKKFSKSVEGVIVLEFRIKCSGNSKVGIAEIQIR